MCHQLEATDVLKPVPLVDSPFVSVTQSGSRQNFITMSFSCCSQPLLLACMLSEMKMCLNIYYF